MITKLQIDLDVVGATFSPESLPGGVAWVLASSNNPGDMGSVGRYRGKPLPYGSATLTPTKPLILDLDEAEVCQFFEGVQDNLELLRKAGGEEIHLTLAVTYRDQCNFEVSPTALDLLAKLALPLSVSCYPE